MAPDCVMEFAPYEGDLMGLLVDENHMVFQWLRYDCKILFSVSRRGNAASCHFASDKAGLRLLREAMNSFAEYVFWLFDWCTMILAQVERPSVGRLIKTIGFLEVAQADDVIVYARLR